MHACMPGVWVKVHLINTLHEGKSWTDIVNRLCGMRRSCPFSDQHKVFCHSIQSPANPSQTYSYLHVQVHRTTRKCLDRSRFVHIVIAVFICIGTSKSEHGRVVLPMDWFLQKDVLRLVKSRAIITTVYNGCSVRMKTQGHKGLLYSNHNKLKVVSPEMSCFKISTLSTPLKTSVFKSKYIYKNISVFRQS